MQPDEGIRVVGMVSVALTWLAIGYIILITPRVLSKSISHHAAVNIRPYYLFATLMTTAMLLMYVFMAGWLAPALLLPIGFTALITVAILLEVVATWIPLSTGWKYTVHQVCSYGAALLMPAILLFILSSPLVNEVARTLCIGALLLMAFLTLLGVFVKATHKHYLIYQSSYIVAFHGAILSSLLYNVIPKYIH